MNTVVEKTMMVTNDKGNQLEVVCVEHPTEGIKPVGNQEHAFCLTCGTADSSALELYNVLDTEGLKRWLNKREHYVNPEQNVLLCIFCGYDVEYSNSNSEEIEE